MKTLAALLYTRLYQRYARGRSFLSVVEAVVVVLVLVLALALALAQYCYPTPLHRSINVIPAPTIATCPMINRPAAAEAKDQTGSRSRYGRAETSYLFLPVVMIRGVSPPPQGRVSGGLVAM